MSTLAHLFRHHRWTSMALVEAIAALPADVLGLTSPRSQEALARMVEGEKRYLAAGMP